MSIHIEYAAAKSTRVFYGPEAEVFDRDPDPDWDEPLPVLVLSDNEAHVLTGTREELILLALRILTELTEDEDAL